ncbi:hypothetical protein VTI74DRAFT_980 [Chaetomium olivicolor]
MLPPALSSLVEPFSFMCISLSYLPSTLLSLLAALDFRTLLSWPRLQAAWFGRFWARMGPEVRLNAEKNVVPLLQGHVRNGRILPQDSTDAAGPAVSGTVIEVGPGSGMWTSIFTPKYLPNVTKVFGVEPNPAQHRALAQQVAAAGLDDGTYEIVPLGIEDLATSGRVPKESVDCIVTVMCLCSIPEPRHHITQLYGYLKPGGRWYVYEHVKCYRSQGWGMRLYQAILDFFWPHIIGGCEMSRDTEKWLKEAGPWSEIDLCQLEGEPWYFTMPHTIGVLTK